MPTRPGKSDTFFVLLFLILFTSACGAQDDDLLRRTQFIMGTLVEITIGDADRENSGKAVGKAFDEMRRVEQLMSTYIDDSEISRLNANAGGEFLSVADEVLTVIQRGIHWGNLSSGALDITIGPVANLWRFDGDKSSPPEATGLKKALPLIDYRSIEILDSRIRLEEPGMALQLGSIAKGYAVDRAMDVLKGSGIQNAIINAGGDLQATGKRHNGQSWKIGIQHPRAPEKMIVVFDLSDKAVATSGDYQKYFMHDETRYHHILNPQNAMPARGVISATIIADTTMDADALATAAFVLGPARGIQLIDSLAGVEGMIVAESGAFHFSKNFQSLPGFVLQGLEDDFPH